MDLNAIQDKLIRQVDALSQGQADVPVDWPQAKIARHPAPKRVGEADRLAELSMAVETLKQRSVQSSSTASTPASRPSPPPQGASGVAVDPGVYLRRMGVMVDKINHLSVEQERAMAEMQTIQARLATISPHLLSEAGFATTLPAVNFANAVIASAELDPRGNIALTYRTVCPPQPDHEARHLADHLRGTYSRSRRPKGISLGEWGPVLALLWQEPTRLISLGWHHLQGWLFPDDARATTTNSGRRSQKAMVSGSLSWVDAVLWFGGGVIGRVALNLLLAAFPALWSVAVAAVTAITAYALYRATLAPKPDFALAYRVFLAVGGLVIGGQI